MSVAIRGGSAGVRGGSSPDAGRFSPVRLACAGLGLRRRAGARSGCWSIRARRISRRRSIASACSNTSGSPSGTSTGTRATRLPGYSLLFAPLASLLGLRVLAACSVLASVALFERLVLGVYGRSARWGALGSPLRPSAILDRAADVRAGRHLRRRRRAGARPRASPLGRAAGGAVRGCQPRRGRPAGARGAHRRARAALAARADGAGAAGRRGRRAARAAVWRRRLRAVPDHLVRGDRAGRALLFLWALPAGQRLLRIGGVVYLLACCSAWSAHARWAATSSATRCCWPGRCCCVPSQRRMRGRAQTEHLGSRRWRLAARAR